MNKTVKLAVAVVIAIVIGVAALLSYVLFGLDPNAYKPQLQEAARHQGIELDISGELDWKLFPRIAIRMGETRFASESMGLPESSFSSAALVLEWWPLLRQKIAVNALEIDGGNFHFTGLAQAGGALAAPVDPQAKESPVREDNDGLALAIERIAITDSRLRLSGDDGDSVFEDVNIASGDINSRGRSFPVEISFRHSTTENPKPITVKATARAAFDQEKQLVTVESSQLSVSDYVEETLTINAKARLDLASQTLNLEQLEGSLGTLNLRGEATINHLDTQPAASGNLKIESNNLRATLNKLVDDEIRTANPNVLKKLSAQTHFAASAELVSLDTLQINLDDSEFHGNLRMRLAVPRNLEANLRGSNLNLDDYSPPAAEPNTAPGDTTSGTDALFAPLAAPIALLDGGKGTLHLALESLVVAGVTINNPEFTVDANGKKIHVHDLRLGIFGGLVNAELSADLSTDVPQISFNNQLADIDIRALQQQFSEDADLSGKLTMNIEGTSQGVSRQALLDNLNASGTLQLDEPRLSTINLERSYCELAALVEKTPARQQPWPAGTQLNTVKSSFDLRGLAVKLSDYTTGVGNLNIRGDGTIDLDEEHFDIRVIARLQGDRTSADGCEVKSKRVRDRDIPLLCKDSFADAGAGSCKPDPDAVKQLLKNEVMDRLLEKAGEGDNGEGVEGLLRGLFKR
ncbi:MAG: AsmA family protein [Porticoccaceae bacterium]